MKVKLLKRLRRIGRGEVNIISITKTDGVVTGMRYGHDGGYSGLFSYGDTEEVVLQKACKIFLENNMPSIRERYKKYSRKFNH